MERLKSKRGLAFASEETRKRVASMGGKSKHEVRGLQGVSDEKRKEIGRKGGFARAKKMKHESRIHISPS